MGTGSQRKKRSRYEQYRLSGSSPTPQLSGIPTAPLTGVPHTMSGRPTLDPRFQGPAGPVIPLQFGATTVESNSPMLRIFQGLKSQGVPDAPLAPKPIAAEGGGGLTLEQQFNQLYGDPSADIRNAYAGQEAAINKQYDQMLARLGTEHGQAERGVRQEGAQLQTALKSIGADATAQLAASNRSIDQDYAKALRAVNNDYKPLAADLKAQGAGGAGLQAEAAAGRADLREAHNTDSVLGQRYSQMLSQEINNRQATGATVTTANVDDLARILSQSRDNANGDRLQAVAKIEASLAGDLAQAKSQRNSARYSFFLDALKSGGTLGEAATKFASPSVRAAARKDVIAHIQNWATPFKGVLKSKNEDESSNAAFYLGQIQTKKMTPEQAFAHWNANPDSAKAPNVTAALIEAMAYGQQFSPQVQKATNAELAAGGYAG